MIITATIKNTTITGNPKDIFFGKLDPLGNPIWIKTEVSHQEMQIQNLNNFLFLLGQ